ncbi:hypothetical protein D3C85_1068340 [compost metagenome]
MLPAHPVGAHRVFRRLGGFAGREQGLDHVVGVGGLLHIVDGAGLDRRDGGGDGAIAGQHDDAGVLAALADGLDHLQAVAVLQPHVQHGEGGDRDAQGVAGLGHRTRQSHVEAPGFQRPTEAGAQGRVVVQQQQGLVGQGGDTGFEFGHSVLLTLRSCVCAAWSRF